MAILESWNFVGGSSTGTNGTTLTVANSASPGTYRNASGVLVQAGATEPRIDYDENGTCLGLLIEETKTERTSDLRNQTAFEFTNSSWLGLRVVVVDNAITDPFGTANSAATITDLNDGTSDSPELYANQAHTNGTTHCLSIFLKSVTIGSGASGNQWVEVDCAVVATNTKVWFNLADGTKGTQQANVQWSGIEAYADGWYRVWVAVDPTTTSTGTIKVSLRNADNSSAAYNSDGRSIGIDLCQNEFIENRTVNQHPSSYSTGNRTDEEVNTSDVDFWTNPSTCSIYGEFQTHYGTGGIESGKTLFSMRTADASSYISPFPLFTDDWRMGWLNNPGDDGQATAVNALNNDGSIERFCWTGANNDQYMSCNGISGSDLTATMPLSDTVNKMCIGWTNSSNTQLNGHIRQLVIWDEQLSDATADDYSTNGYTASTSFPGNIAGDGGHVWPARANDPRWTQIITDSGITATGNFQDDVRAALRALSGASGGSPDDLWKKVKAANGVTDTSEPWLY